MARRARAFGFGLASAADLWYLAVCGAVEFVDLFPPEIDDRPVLAVVVSLRSPDGNEDASLADFRRRLNTASRGERRGSFPSSPP
jgi:hypothetical protein